MTQVTEIQAGPELDAEIARRVFDGTGEEWICPHCHRGDRWGQSNPLEPDPSEKTVRCHRCGRLSSYLDNFQARAPEEYSTDIAAAWDVVEKMRERGWQFSLSTGTDFEPEYVGGPNVVVYFRHIGGYPNYPVTVARRDIDSGETGNDVTPFVCLAICHAALAALGAET